MSMFRPRAERVPRPGPNADPTCPLCGERGVTFVRRSGSLVCIECARTGMRIVADVDESDER